MHRVIARLDVKGDRLIKSIQLDGVRVVGDPRMKAQEYYQQGADELLFMDAVASLYGRNHLAEVVRYTAESVFIPLTVGGGLRTLDDVRLVLQAGADKVSVNTAAVCRPEFISEVAREFGSQCMVLQIDAKRRGPEAWEAYTDGGREPTGLDVVAWAQQGVQLGAGEILLTSVDQEGTGLGFDLELCKAVAPNVSVPVIASGGMGSTRDLIAVIKEGQADAAAMADILHVKKQRIDEIKAELLAAGIAVRMQ